MPVHTNASAHAWNSCQSTCLCILTPKANVYGHKSIFKTGPILSWMVLRMLPSMNFRLSVGPSSTAQKSQQSGFGR